MNLFNNNFNIFRFALIPVILITIISCNSFLDETDPSHFTTESFFEDATDAERAVNSIYSSVYPIYDLQSWMITLVRTGIADTNFPDDAGYPNLTEPKNLGNFSRHTDLKQLWNSYFKGIANANLAIENIPNIETLGETEMKKLIGQAYFLRGYYYFELVRMFGELPLLTEPIESLNDPNVLPHRSPVDSIYNLIVEDLTKAESAGLPNVDRTGRVSNSAVKALLSSVYLTMAGYPLQAGDEYYKKAMDKAGEIIVANNYNLPNSYDFLKDPSQNNQGEFIYQIQFDQDNHPNNTLQFANVPYRSGISAYSSEEGFVFVVDEFLKYFDNEDKRKEAFFYDRYTSNADRKDTVYFDNTYVFKFFNKEAIEESAKSDLNWPILRFSEVLLNFAEASNEVNGPNPEAYDAINKIRKRAGTNNLSNLSKSEFRKEIWLERYRELGYENKVWFDMARTRKALNLSTGNFDDYEGHIFTYGKTLEERDLLFPLPDDEIRNNPNLEQNPGF